MAPKVARTQSSCESGEGLSTIHRLLNGLHLLEMCPKTNHMMILYGHFTLHFLGPTWTYPIPISIKNNMTRENWYTPNPFQAKSGISSSKWKWMNNKIYELIMLSKSIVIAKLELLTTVLIFCNLSANTFDFRMGPMTLTILDMVHVFGLRLSGRVINVTHDWAPHSLLIAESLGNFGPIIQLETRADLVWIASVLIRQLGFRQAIPIPFFDSVQCGTSYRLHSPPKMDVGQDEEVGDVFVLQKAVAEAERQNDGASGDVSELLGDSEGKTEIVVEHQATHQTRAIVVETSDPRETLLKKRTRAQVVKSSKSSASMVEAGVGRKKQKASRPQVTKKPNIISRKDPLGAEMYQKAKDMQDSTLAALEPSPTQEFQPASTTFGEPIIPKILVVLEVISPRAFGEGLGTIPPSPVSGSDPPPATRSHYPSFQGLGLYLATSLSQLVKKFGQIETKLQSPSPSFESPLLQNVRQIFKDWMKRDFNASFSLKILHDAEKALTELYNAQLLSKAQYESFLSFFENLQALRDQYQKAERAFNRVKCFQEKHTKTSATLQQLVEEGSVMEDRIAVVDAKIQRLENQLSSLKAEKMSLTNHLSKKVEEMENISQEVEDSKNQLTNNNTYLGEPSRIFIIMQTYFSRIVALTEDAKLLG
ncbi:hypothetical protein D8674_034810 [Pyrus ussuriensis x Pyrus communis]|uniref:TMV resistance protein N-like n=1 Tax=Pyrus ussuriensis x Pyrus communis TaxID=2448454 RepID=A0A5N5GP30_9ROSA|nr:hypothetical protein D8674_034810 [Pyrus ussuriensis x Pyrus communis]